MSDELQAAVGYLRSPLAIRARCENVFEAGMRGELAHFAIALDQLGAVADRVVEVTRKAYPDLAIPVHGRINHFRAGGVDRVAPLAQQLAALPSDEQARTWIDLIVVSVLLDAGAGDSWRYREAATGLAIGRSEGLAVASLHAFLAGAFAASPTAPLRADAAALGTMTAGKLATLFQVAPDNPLVGLDGRAALITALGAAVAANPTIFPGGRPGGLADYLRARAPSGGVEATAILAALLEGLAPIWPGRIVLGGANLGDVWRHPQAGGTGATAGMIPFHKLSQWLAYSLFEPLEQAGVPIKHPGALTGLPEYRNGGLFVDLGVLVPKHAGVLTGTHAPGDEVIVEWRALTVALLDRTGDLVRQRLGKTPDELPLANILEGGTWATGRVVAAERRAGGGSPIQIASDGTVF